MHSVLLGEDRQLLRQRYGTPGALLDLRHVVASLRQVRKSGWSGVGQRLRHEIRVVHYDSMQIVELVGHAASELA